MGAARRDKLLRVDLSSGKTRSEPVPPAWLDAYIGGKGLGARYLYEELEAGVDPLGPDNRILFMLGPLSGTTPGEQRYAAITKSPLTGTFLDSYAGGSVPERLAGALDRHIGLLIEGQADGLVTLHVEDGAAEIEPADHLEGATADAVDEAFPDAAVACIGPAGEHLVNYATIASDGGEHQAGRGGAGAVLGSKRLKALVVQGEPPHWLEELREAAREAFAQAHVGRWQGSSGTLETIDFANEVGALPTRGWQTGTFEAVDDIGIEAVRGLAAGRERTDDAVPGDFRVQTADGETVPRGGAPLSLGAGLGIDDMDAVAELTGRCDRLGLDLISVGSAIAFAIRAGELGYLDTALEFGDVAGATALVEAIATRSTALADTLADGVESAADAIGGEELIPTVKAMELPGFDPRASPAMALAYATSDRGACHRRARPVEDEPLSDTAWSHDRRVEAVIEEQDRRALLWSLPVDDFVGDSFDDLGAEWLAAIGRKRSPDDLRRVGERIWTLIRLFNVREGFDRSDDTLPARLTEPLPDGPAAGQSIDAETFTRLLDRYYEKRGWGLDGRPTHATIDRLALHDAVDDTAMLLSQD